MNIFLAMHHIQRDAKACCYRQAWADGRRLYFSKTANVVLTFEDLIATDWGVHPLEEKGTAQAAAEPVENKHAIALDVYDATLYCILPFVEKHIPEIMRSQVGCALEAYQWATGEESMNKNRRR